MAALVLAWPWLFGGLGEERVQIARLEALAIWTETLRDTISAHASLEQAIPVSAATAPPLLRPALVRLIGRLRARVPLDAALLRLAADLDDARSADPLIAALILHARRRGDRLADVLTGLATTARAELELRRKILASRAELRRGVQIIIAITLAMAGYLAVFNPAFTRPYGTAIGQLALLAVIALFAGGLAWLRRLARPEPVLAFLPRPGAMVDPDGLRLVASLTGVRARAARHGDPTRHLPRLRPPPREVADDRPHPRRGGPRWADLSAAPSARATAPVAAGASRASGRPHRPGPERRGRRPDGASRATPAPMASAGRAAGLGTARPPRHRLHDTASRSRPVRPRPRPGHGSQTAGRRGRATGRPDHPGPHPG